MPCRPVSWRWLSGLGGEGDQSSRKSAQVRVGRRCIPNAFVTTMFVLLGTAAMVFGAVMTVYGSFDQAATRAMWILAWATLAGFSYVVFCRTTVVLGSGRVRSGWPRSRWWDDAAVGEIYIVGSHLAGEVWMRSRDGGTTRCLVVVMSGFLGFGSSAARAEAAKSAVVVALGARD